jgi:hypothetical protein
MDAESLEQRFLPIEGQAVRKFRHDGLGEQRGARNAARNDLRHWWGYCNGRTVGVLNSLAATARVLGTNVLEDPSNRWNVIKLLQDFLADSMLQCPASADLVFVRNIANDLFTRKMGGEPSPPTPAGWPGGVAVIRGIASLTAILIVRSPLLIFVHFEKVHLPRGLADNSLGAPPIQPSRQKSHLLAQPVPLGRIVHNHPLQRVNVVRETVCGNCHATIIFGTDGK